MQINQQLRDLYASKWQGLTTAMRSIMQEAQSDEIPASPLLLKIGDEKAYAKADIKLLIFGQETNKWYESFHDDAATIIGYYDEFFNSGRYQSYGGQFWNGVRRFIDLLQERYPSKSIYPVWNNIVKIGRDAGIGFPTDSIHEVEREWFNVIADEIKILQPTIVLFFTGPNYDTVIQSVFGEIQYEPVSDDFSIRQLASLDLPNAGLAFRTYHPNYLWRNNINNYFQAVIDDVKLN